MLLSKVGDLLDKSGLGVQEVAKVVAVVSDFHVAPEAPRGAKLSVLEDSRSNVERLCVDDGDLDPLSSGLVDSTCPATSKTEKVLSGLTLTCFRFRCRDLTLDGRELEGVEEVLLEVWRG